MIGYVIWANQIALKNAGAFDVVLIAWAWFARVGYAIHEKKGRVWIWRWITEHMVAIVSGHIVRFVPHASECVVPSHRPMIVPIFSDNRQEFPVVLHCGVEHIDDDRRVLRDAVQIRLESSDLFG